MSFLELIADEVDRAYGIGEPVAVLLSRPAARLLAQEVRAIGLPVRYGSVELYGLPVEIHECVALASVRYR